MAQPSPANALPLPPWLMAVGSVLIAGHFLTFGVSVLAAPSGPWPTPYGRDMAVPPTFAITVDNVTRDNYLRPLKMTHNYHFLTNQAEMPGVYFVVRLKNENGEQVAERRFPEESANPWARHRQQLLARHLLEDRPVQPPAGEVIAPPGQHVQMVSIWEAGPDRTLRPTSVPEHLIPRDRPVSRPSELSLTLARSYARYLCRAHGAASAEIVRYSREPLSPAVLFQPDTPPGAMDELVASFGEMPR